LDFLLHVIIIVIYCTQNCVRES